MSRKEDHKIKKLVQSVDLDSPSANFAAKVMDGVIINMDDASLKDVYLTSLLKNNVQETTSVNFISHVMAQVQKGVVSEQKPIISNKVWVILFILFLSVVSLVVFGEHTPTNEIYISKYVPIFEKIVMNFANSIVENSRVPSILTMSVFCLSILLLLDYFLRTKDISNN